MNAAEQRDADSIRAIAQPDMPPLPEGLEERLGECRPFSAGSMALLQQVKNEWLLRIPPTEMENHYFATMSWLFIHTAPEREVRSICFGPRDAFLNRVLDWADKIGADGKGQLTAMQLAACDAIITDLLGLVQKAQISIVEKPDAPGEDKNAPPNS